MYKEILQLLMNPIIWWFETISSLGSQSLGLTWVCWLQDRVLIGPSVCYIFPATKLENALLFVAGEFNIPVGMLKFVFGLLAAYPLALLIRFIPCSSSSLKHFIGAISGLCVLQFVFGSDWLHPVVSSIGTYLLFFVVPRKNLPMAVTLWSLGYLVLAYIYRMYVFYNMDLFDFTRCQMVMTVKFMQLGYNLYDGYVYTTCSTNATVQFDSNDGKGSDAGNVGDGSSNSSSRNSTSNSNSGDSNKSSSSNTSQPTSLRQQRYLDNMHRQRRLCAIVHPPSLLPYCGYMFGVTGLLAGPALEYSDYIRAMDGSIYLQHTTATKKVSNNHSITPAATTTTTSTQAPPTPAQPQPQPQPPESLSGPSTTPVIIPSSTLLFSSLGACVHRTVVALVCLLLYFALASKCPISRHRDAYWQTHTPVWQRLAYIWVSFLGERCKFYFVWKISEATCILAGLGFQWDDTPTDSISHHNHSNSNSNNQPNHNNSSSNSIRNNSSNNNQHNGNNNNKGNNITTTNNTTTNTTNNNHEGQSPLSWNWRGASCVDILAAETAPNMSSLTRAWNQRVQHWLERYVYQRVHRSLLVTYLVSALWHGLYPGYLLFFLVAAAMGQIERLVREKINPWVIPEGGASSGDYSPGPEHSISASTSTIPYMGPGTTTRGFQQPEKTTFTITEKSAKKGGNNKDITSSTSTSRPLKTLSSSKSLNSLVGALTGIPLFETSISTATMTERGYHVVCWMVTSMTLMYFIQTFYLKTWDRCYTAFASFSFLPHAMLLLVYAVLVALPVKTPIKTKKA